MKPGANADIALLELRDGNFEMTDSDGNTVTAKERLIARMTLKDGRICYERPGVMLSHVAPAQAGVHLIRETCGR